MTQEGLLNDFPINPKWAITTQRIQAYVPEDGYYVAFSGGKDSIVLYDLMLKSGVKFDAHFNFTTVDPPELVGFIREYYPEVSIERPSESMFHLIERKTMPPTRIARYCCEVLKEGGGKGRMVATGIRWEESARRSRRMMVECCQKDATKHFFHPIIDWTTAEIWEYIHAHKLPYCSLYDEGYTRLGCILCPMQTVSGKLRDIEHWPKFYRAYIRCFDRMLKRLQAKGKPIYNSWKTGQDVMDWWIYGSNQPEGQVTLFDN